MSKYYIKAYTLNWNNEESDSLHLCYSYDGKEWYELNGNNGVLFASLGSKRMHNPRFVRKTTGDYRIMALDALDHAKMFVYSTKDFIEYTDEIVTNSDSATEYTGASDIIEITENETITLQKKWGKPEPVTIKNIDEIKVEVPKHTTLQDAMPTKIKVTYSNDDVEEENVEWDDADISQAGTYKVSGRIIRHMYQNPLIYHRADPYVYKHTDGYYYFTASYTDMEHNLQGAYQYIHIIVRRAKSLADLADGSGAYEEKTVFDKAPLKGTDSPHIWAPEIHFIQGRWYIYYTMTTDDNNCWAIRPHVLTCIGDPMTTSWTNLGTVQVSTRNSIAFTDFSLDHTVLQHGGNLYLFWAEKHPAYSDIYAAKMINPWTIDSSRICKVVAPSYNWELHGFPVCEGPGFLVRNGRIFMTYSASGTDSLYCLGMVTADENSDLLDPNSWTKSPYPVFQSSDKTGQYGPGHNSFTIDEDGHDVMVYHARQEKKYLVDRDYQPLYDAGRNASISRVYWNTDGTPNFSIPVCSGEDRYEYTKVEATVVVK